MGKLQDQHLESFLAEVRQKPIELMHLEQYRAIPSIGGVISDKPMHEDIQRFGKNNVLPISRRAATSFENDVFPSNRWRAVVLQDGTKAAVRADEAQAFGLEDIGDWTVNA